MKHQAHLGTKSDIVSREAAQIRILIDDLAHTVDVLDAGVATDLLHRPTAASAPPAPTSSISGARPAAASSTMQASS